MGACFRVFPNRGLRFLNSRSFEFILNTSMYVVRISLFSSASQTVGPNIWDYSACILRRLFSHLLHSAHPLASPLVMYNTRNKNRRPSIVAIVE